MTSGMNKDDRHSGQRPREGKRRTGRERILRSTAVLPSLVTTCNGIAGFGAIHFATKDGLGFATMENLATACWLLVIAMVCDVLDGRLARMTRRTSDFGGQLDSLCDVISFGVAPAMLMVRATIPAIHGWLYGGAYNTMPIERVVWCIGAVFMACAALRLARFNVENVADESAHMHFRGLPSPGAAGVVVTVVLLIAHVSQLGWLEPKLLHAIVSIALPLITLAAGLLMISRFDYPHIVNQYIRGKRPFSYLVKAVIVVIAALLEPFATAAAVAVLYMFWGPVRATWRAVRPAASPPHQP